MCCSCNFSNSFGRSGCNSCGGNSSGGDVVITFPELLALNDSAFGSTRSGCGCNRCGCNRCGCNRCGCNRCGSNTAATAFSAGFRNGCNTCGNAVAEAFSDGFGTTRSGCGCNRCGCNRCGCNRCGSNTAATAFAVGFRNGCNRCGCNSWNSWNNGNDGIDWYYLRQYGLLNTSDCGCNG